MKYESQIVSEVVRSERDPARTKPCDACHGLGAEKFWPTAYRPMVWHTCWTCDGWGWVPPETQSRFDANPVYDFCLDVAA